MKQRKLFKSQRAKRGEGRKDKNVPIFVSTGVKSILDTLKKAYSNCHFEGKVNGHVTYNQLFRRLVATVGLAADQDVMKEFKKLSNEKAQLDKTVAPVTAVDVATVAQAADGVAHSEAPVTPEKECNNGSSSEELPKDNVASDKFYFIDQAGKTVEAHVGDSAFYAILNNKYVGCWNMYLSHWKLLCPDGRIVEEFSEAKAIYLKEKRLY